MTYRIHLNNMKRNTLILILLAMVGSVFATLVSPFRSWSNLVDNSPDIIIARCNATPGFTLPGISPRMEIYPQTDVEVVSVLKGNTKCGSSRLSSFYNPYQGELFVAFSTYMTLGTNSWYNANEEYKIIPLNSDFRISDLDGKTLDEQIQLILASRLKDLNDEIARDNEEIYRLNQGLKPGVGASTNTPTTILPK